MTIAANGSKAAAGGSGRRLSIPLSLKFAAVSVALALLLLALGGAAGLWWAYNGTERSAFEAERQKAEMLAGRIGGVVAELQSQIAWTTQPSWTSAGVEQQRADFTRMLRQFPAITELFYIDGKGFEQLKVSRFAPDSVASRTNHGNEPRFVETVKARTWFGPVYVRNGAELATTVGMAHPDGGVTVAEIDLAFVSGLVNAVGQDDGIAFVVDGTGRLIAHPGKNAITEDGDMSALPQVAAALAATGSGTTADALTDDGTPALAAFAEVPTAGWRVIAQMPKSVALAPFYTLAWQSGLLALAGLLVAAAAGIWMARRVTVPIRKLQTSAELLGEGDLTQRVAVRRRDEIGVLADRFNTLASQLQQNRKGLEAEADDRAQGMDIAQQQQGLTLDMLQTISRTDYQLERVLDTLIGDAVRLTEANVGAVWLRDGDAFRLAAQLGHTREWVDSARKEPFTAGSETHAMAAAAAFSGQIINVDDVLRDVRFAGDYGERPAYSDERSALALPLRHAGRVVAVFALSRGDPLPFPDRQVALAQSFADQALVAIRHMLLLDEIQTRDRKLAQASEEQSAADDIVRLIAKSPASAGQTLDAIARNAARFCDAPHCHIELFDGERLHLKAVHGLPPEAIELAARTFPREPLPGTADARAIETRAAVEIADLQAEQEAGPLSALLGSKSVVAVPVLSSGRPIGVLTVERQEAGALPARQIELLKSFADQTAITLESARLSGDLNARTSGLAASLDRETATGALLRAVSRTDYDLNEVLAGLAGRAARECAADDAQFFRLDGEVLRDASGEVASAEGHASLARRVVAGTAVLNVPDAWQDPEHAGKFAGTRSMLGLPLLAKGKIFGAMTLARGQTLPFDEQQATLASELADQAALAIAGTQLPLQLAERTAERDEARHRHVTDVEAGQHQHAQEMDEARRLHAAEMQETRERHETEAEETRQRHETELGEIRRQHAEELADRTSERDEARHLHVTDVEVAQQQHLAEVQETRQLHATEMEEIRQRHAAELSDILRRHAEEIAERTVERDEARHLHVTDLAAAQKQHAAEMDETRRLHAAEMGETRLRHETGVEDTRQRHEAELAEIQRLHAEESRATIEAHAAELAGTISSYTAELDSARHLHVTEVGEARDLHARELDEARRLNTEERALAGMQQRATAEALKRVADPSSGLDAVLQAVVGSAARACGASASILFSQARNGIEARAASGLPEENRETVLATVRDTLAAQAISQGKTLHVARMYAGNAAFSALGVPVLRDGAAQAAMVLLRDDAEPFGDELAALAESFADQASIAIETERLSDLAAGRADQLDEAQRFRAAAARVLDLVGSVEDDPQPALDAVVTTVAELCRATSAELSLSEGDVLRPIAAAGAAGGEISAARRVIAEGRAIHIAAEAGAAVRGAELAVPLVIDGKVAGSLALRREEGAFGEHEIELASTLAAQAAIALTRARLAAALSEQTQDLGRALGERETTARMLTTLGRSRFDLGAVLDTLARSAAELCGADAAAICLDDAGALIDAGSTGFPVGWPGDGTHPQAASLAARVVREAVPLRSSGYDGATDNTLAVPLLAAGRVAGVLGVVRPAPFGDEDVSVASMLADQAAIAVENVRLLEEAGTRAAEFGEALRQQAATAEGLKAINRAGLDLGVALSSLTQSAAVLCAAGTSTIHLLEDGAYHLAAATGISKEGLTRESTNPIRAGRDSWVGRTAQEKAIIHVPDAASDTEAAGDGAASVLCVPLLREGAVVGVFTLTRPEPGRFSDGQIRLVQAFADQAAIAAETVRLADEVTARSAEVAETLRQQTAVAYAARTITRSTGDLDKVLNALTASAAALCNTASSEIYRLEDGAYRLSAATGASSVQPGMDALIERAAVENAVVHVADLSEANATGAGAALCVPLMRGSAIVGVFALTRSEPFTERQIELVRTFADHAVIAIETARLSEAAEASASELAETLHGLHSLQKRAGEMERLASLGQSTSGIANEIRSSLDSLRDFSAVSNRLVDDIRMVLEGAVIDGGTRAEVEDLGDVLKANLGKVVEFGKRADSIVANMLHLGEDQGAGGHRPVDINAVVDESLGIAYHGVRAERQDFDVKLEKAYDPAAGKIDLDPQEISRALLFLISNGLQAAARRGEEMDGTAYQPVLAASTRSLGDAVEIRIRDNGTGISPEVKAKMFNPFFTTKPAGEGAGLGLSLSRDIIVRLHSGTIDVETVPGSFTEFRIVLPRDAAPVKRDETTAGNVQSS